MTNVKQSILADIEGLKQALENRGFKNCFAEGTFRTSDLSSMRIDLHYKVEEGRTTEYVYIREYELSEGGAKSVTWDDMVEHAHDLIAGRPSLKEVRIKEFVNLMERLREESVDLGIDADLVNPLMSLMERLASNALPAPRK